MAFRFTLRQLEYFVTVGEQGTIVQASALVNVSPSSVSAAISQLEDEFGLPLFVRKHAQGLSLTQTGRQFIEQARKVLAEAESLSRLAGTVYETPQGPLNIGCLVTFAQVLLPAIRREFQLKYSDVQVSQIECDQQTLIEKLRRAQIDVALTYDLEIPRDLAFIPLRSLPLYAVVAANHELAKRKSVAVTTLVNYPMVLLDLPMSRTYFMSVFEKAGCLPNIAERTRDMAVMRSLVANGFGFSVANIRPHSDLSPDGRKLCFIPLEGTQRPMRLGFIVPEDTRRILSVNTFMDHASKTISDWGYPGVPVESDT